MSVYFRNDSTQTIHRGIQTPKINSPAKFTMIKVDRGAGARLNLLMRKHGKNVIREWLRKPLKGLVEGTKDSIKIWDARIINSKAGTQVFEINKENVIAFAVDDVIRCRMSLLNDISPLRICKKLEIPDHEFKLLKNGIKSKIEKQYADKFNEYFGGDLFDLDRIFQLALNEPIPGIDSDRMPSICKKRRCSELTESEGHPEFYAKRPRTAVFDARQTEDLSILASASLYMDRFSVIESISSHAPQPKCLDFESPRQWSDWTLFSISEAWRTPY